VRMKILFDFQCFSFHLFVLLLFVISLQRFTSFRVLVCVLFHGFYYLVV
jgi:hypothetical protein